MKKRLRIANFLKRVAREVKPLIRILQIINLINQIMEHLDLSIIRDFFTVKWVNHIAIAGATCAVWKPELVPLAVLGSTAPDWLEWVLQAMGRRVRHRTVTHYAASWLFGLGFGVFVWDYHHALTAFAAGGLSHVFCDSLTVQGVPLGWWSDRRFHLFGGRFRTGQSGEYWFSGAIVLACMARRKDSYVSG